MRKSFAAGILVGLLVPNLHADSRPIQKIALVVLSKDAALSTAIESGVKDDFAQRGINASSLRTIFVSTVPVPVMISQIRNQHFDSLLCLSPRRTIQWSSPTSTSTQTDSGMQGCLSTYVTGNYPSGDPLEVSPLAEDRSLPPMARAPDSLRDPIPTSPDAASYRLVKGQIRLFDVPSGELIWQKTVVVKMPEGLETNLQVKLIVHEIWENVIEAGLLPKP